MKMLNSVCRIAQNLCIFTNFYMFHIFIFFVKSKLKTALTAPNHYVFKNFSMFWIFEIFLVKSMLFWIFISENKSIENSWNFVYIKKATMQNTVHFDDFWMENSNIWDFFKGFSDTVFKIKSLLFSSFFFLYFSNFIL